VVAFFRIERAGSLIAAEKSLEELDRWIYACTSASESCGLRW